MRILIRVVHPFLDTHFDRICPIICCRVRVRLILIGDRLVNPTTVAEA